MADPLFGGLLLMLLGARRRGEAAPPPSGAPAGTPPGAFPPPGATTFEPITFGKKPAGPVAKAGPAAAPGIQAELGPLEPQMQKGVPGVRRGVERAIEKAWKPARAPSPGMVARANAINRDPNVPVGSNVTEGNVQYRKRRSGGKLYTYVYVWG